MTRHRRTHTQWTRLVARWRASKLTASELARGHQIDAQQLRGWAWRLESTLPARTGAITLIELAPSAQPRPEHRAGARQTAAFFASRVPSTPRSSPRSSLAFKAWVPGARVAASLVALIDRFAARVAVMNIEGDEPVHGRATERSEHGERSQPESEQREVVVSRRRLASDVAVWRSLRDRVFGWDVFISYAREDEPWAHAVEKLLQLGRFRVFRDRTQLLLGGHLDDLLAHLDKSTMLVVLVSQHAVDSDWVHRELTRYLARPRRRQRLVPVFLDPRYPEELPDRFRVLGDYAGLLLPTVARTTGWAATVAAEADHGRLADAEASALSAGVARHFAASRKATRQLASAAVLAVSAAAVVGVLLHAIHVNEARDALVREAAVASRDARHDVAEYALAQAWTLDRRPSIREAYRQARERRALAQPTALEVTQNEAVLAVDEAGGQPFVILHQADDLVLLRQGKRSTFARSCGGAPDVATQGAVLVWRCGRDLGAMVIDMDEPRSVELPAEPIDLRLRGGHVEILFHEGGVLQRGLFTAPALEPMGLDVLSTDAEGGTAGLCPRPEQLAWRVRLDGAHAMFERWDAATAEARVETLPLPRSADGMPRLYSWIGRASVAPDCERFVLEHAPFSTEHHSTFEATRFRLGAIRAVDRFESGELRSVVVAPDASGLEAVYLTPTKELRAFVLTDVVVRGVTVRSIASNVERIATWPSSDRNGLWLLALARDGLAVYKNGVLWSRHPLAVGEPVRAVASPDGANVVIEGDARAILWRRAQPWSGGDPPAPEAVLADVGIASLAALTSTTSLK